MTCRPFQTCLVICVVVIALGGISCRHTEGVAKLPTTAPSRQALDEAVIEAALVDLATGSDEDSASLRREQGQGKVLLSNKSRDWIGTLRQELQSAESDNWKSLGSADRNAAKEAAQDVIARVDGKQYFTPFRPKDPHISLWEDDPASTQPYDPIRRFDRKPRPIVASPPGYGDGRKLAVVSFGFAWSMHSGDATFVLRFDGKNWKVISRHFAYYV